MRYDANFSDSGESIPVTVVEVLPNEISQIKTIENDGYSSIQVTCGEKKRSRVSKPEGGHFAKSGVSVGRGLWEFKLDSVEGYELGQSLSVSLLEEGQVVDVSSVSKVKVFKVELSAGILQCKMQLMATRSVIGLPVR